MAPALRNEGLMDLKKGIQLSHLAQADTGRNFVSICQKTILPHYSVGGGGPL